jgi:hypothetical protein
MRRGKGRWRKSSKVKSPNPGIRSSWPDRPSFFREGQSALNYSKIAASFDVIINMSPIKQQLLKAIEEAPEELIEQILQDLLTPKNPLQNLIQSGRIIAPSRSRNPIDETEFQTFTQSLTGTSLSDLIIDDREQW